MTESRRPPACRYDRDLGERVTTDHRDDCPDPSSHRGCAPCTARHCVVCGHAHATNDHPDTCPTCIGKVRKDLDDINDAVTDLHIEATDAGADGRLVAAAPIPGGNAAVLVGPSVPFDQLRTGRKYTDVDVAEVHHPNDPLPPLAVLAMWEDVYRAWLGHTPAARATVTGAVRYFEEQLDRIANHRGDDPPDWPLFTRQIRSLRAQLERALHDEREPELGVECFECGDRLVRRFRDAKRCRHATPARRRFRVLLSYPELRVYPTEIREALLPCAKCSQGGLDDPRAGQSWECPGCRKEYDAGEYATAIRRDLLDNGDQGQGWTHIRMAADAASTLVGVPVLPTTIRKWAERDKVASTLTEGGQRLVYWPDVAAEAVAAVARAQEAEERRRARAALEERFWRELGPSWTTRRARSVAKQLGIDKAWLQRLLDTVAA